ncbi:hypothetical protein PUNSTDRAFT_137982 [Punctularia strigosozonata HHB-11173 SS5]|uniref:Uncharacterized protein n=1 Tax=Punctularia strigosozonata (strain HHB-11173) TaxID=741275 RepID=R7S4I8_PUNST|nr:uncharacterized protein PUNSTDRAFT_137982 [Punctularia strigosozonata HHB-11173 SS5]EIN05300.1 hypothetical protein PUNSTDRAFT_137982 [Punctularia strigosozonata HHB-11173 SS5]
MSTVPQSPTQDSSQTTPTDVPPSPSHDPSQSAPDDGSQVTPGVPSSQTVDPSQASSVPDTTTSPSMNLITVTNAVNAASQGHDINNDQWMNMWCNTNWGDLLQPAPLSISLLGSVMIIASSTDDFSLISDSGDSTVPSNTTTQPASTSAQPQVTWQFAKYPDSFKACLQQMVGDGYTAFEGAHTNMTRIQNASGQIPALIAQAVQLVINGSPREVQAFLGDQLKGILQLANICQEAALASESAFLDICGLAQELVLACTHKVGTTEQKLVANQVHLDVLQVQKDADAQAAQDAKKANDLMQKSFTQAEDDFHNAVKSVPSGWDLVGMGVVQSLTSLLVSAGNAAISTFSLKAQAAALGVGAFNKLTGSNGNPPPVNQAVPQMPPTTSPNGIPTQPNGACLSDPGLLQANSVLCTVNAMKQLVSGGPDGKPDWDQIRGSDSTSGGQYVQATLQEQQQRIDPSMPISSKLADDITTALRIIGDILKISGSVDATDDALDGDKESIDKLVTNLQALVTSCNVQLGQPGQTPVGPATPAPPAANATSNAAQLAVENSKFQVDQTRANLEASRDAYEKAQDRLVKGQAELANTITEITSLSLTNATLQNMLPVLRKAVGAFTTLRAQFSQITQFFESVASLITDVMTPSVSRWSAAMSDAASIAGVTVGAFTRQMIYSQMTVPLKVSMLAEKVASTYLDVSTQFIMPAQRQVGNMLQFPEGTTPADKAALQVKLQKAQSDLAKTATAASQHISALVTADQQGFSKSINSRLASITAAVQPAIPAIAQPVPSAISGVTNARVTDYDATAAATNAANPIYDTSSMI